VVFRADGTTDEVFEIYSRPIDGDGIQTRLNDALPAGGDVASGAAAYSISPDSQWVGFVADGDTDGTLDLYTRRIDGTGAETRFQFGTGFRFASGSARIIYIGLGFNLFTRAVDGSSAAVQINTALPTGGSVTAREVSPDGQRVVYRADGDVDEEFELYSRPADGSGSEVQLNSPLPSGGDVGQTGTPPLFLISANSQWVVYRADGDADQVFELYSRPANGSGSEARLAVGTVSTDFQIAPDSSRAVYRKNSQIYSRAIDGSGVETVLNDPLPIGGDVADFVIAPDASRVVYVAEGDSANSNEIYSRPLDGSGAEVKLNDPFPNAFGHVQVSGQIGVTADSARAVYVASPNADGIYSLYSAAIDGTGPCIELTPTDVLDFALTTTGLAVYTQDNDGDSVADALYAVDVWGTSTPVLLSGSMVSGGHITEFDVASAGVRVVYRADQDADEVFELYSAALGPGLLLGDFGRDGQLSNVDIQAMLDALVDLDGYKTAHGLSDEQLLIIGDIDRNGVLANTDIQAMLDLLTTQGGQSAQQIALEVFGDENDLDGYAAPVPEPASAAAVSLGSLLALRRRRRMA
jgi:Tol biopolymer transport system component